ncbi:uncharacterized protein I303_106152 [Kwoniella dejecticola CBS 10117]|uniref:Uncharacterized protein n=1 Tax=Kwoniella dejecticola CBS 10117 TaxID=1296121 RepID=A0A1A6A1G2_9TREE|nr:uncharacterized protein I303_06170 [Kwoniella dejecticola CBS 10117]OBR83885.1 hypothetical protein I303_06170 [Kwoniella dejecticola CBS 10117]
MTSITPPKINRILPSAVKTDENQSHAIPAQKSSIIAPSSMSMSRGTIIGRGPGDTPQNTPATRPIRSIGIGRKSTLPSSSATGAGPGGGGSGDAGGRPITAANALTAKAIRGGGRGAYLKNGTHEPEHAITPGNTLSSLDQITNRLADNLGGIGEAGIGVDTDNKIAPTYERNFRAGLGELHRRLSSPEVDGTKLQPSPMISPTAPSSLISASAIRPAGSPGLDLNANTNFSVNDWPSSFSDLDVLSKSGSVISGTSRRGPILPIHTPLESSKTPEKEQAD